MPLAETDAETPSTESALLTLKRMRLYESDALAETTRILKRMCL